MLFVGSKGKLMHDTYGDNPRLLPKSLHDSVGEAAAEAAAHRDEPRDELGGRGQGQDGRRRRRSPTRRG